MHLYRVKHIQTCCLIMHYARARPSSEGSIAQLLSKENAYILIPPYRRRQTGKEKKSLQERDEHSRFLTCNSIRDD